MTCERHLVSNTGLNLTSEYNRCYTAFVASSSHKMDVVHIWVEAATFSERLQPPTSLPCCDCLEGCWQSVGAVAVQSLFCLEVCRVNQFILWGQPNKYHKLLLSIDVLQMLVCYLEVKNHCEGIHFLIYVELYCTSLNGQFVLQKEPPWFLELFKMTYEQCFLNN